MTLELTNSILKDVRVMVGLSADTSDFDTDLLVHINSSISKLNQNGVGNFLLVTDDTSTWNDLQNPLQVEGNKYFNMVPTFIFLSTKLIFDPPPPSTVQHYANNIDQSLWRLKVAYEEPYVAPIVEGSE
jgi:hypothetical protein